MKDFTTSFKMAKRNKWILIYNHYYKMYDCFVTSLNIEDRPHIEIIKDFRYD